MAKQSKRSRKFQASGGVSGRLKKGTFTKHGKLKQRTRKDSDKAHTDSSAAANAASTSKAKDRSNDLTASANVADLDLESFFAKVANSLEGTDAAMAEDDPVSADSDSQESSGQEELTATQKKSKETSSDSQDSDSEDDDDDDDDIEAAEARMKKEMARLTEKDPDFHKFLQENEEQLLDFGQDEEEEDDKDRGEDNDEEVAMQEGDKDEAPTQTFASNLLTMAVLDKLRRGTFDSHGAKALKKLITAYKAGCHLADTDGDASKRMYSIDSSNVFDSLMVLCLSRCHEAFKYHLMGESKDGNEQMEDSEAKESEVDPDNKPIPPHKLENAAKWDTIKPILQTFFKATNHLLTESKESGLLSFVLKSLAKYVPMMTAFPLLAQSLLKTCVSIWSAPMDSSENYQVVRLQAFFRIRQLAVTQPFPFIETCLKKCYLAYTQRAAFANASSLATTLPTLTFMGNCLVELYSLDYQSSYQHAFVYIRELALQLRGVVRKKTPESFQEVYGWQFMHSLKLWVAVLADAASKEDEEPDAKLLGSLLYPLTEIIFGTARSAPFPVRLFPLRLQCIRLLQQLAASAQIFIPTTSLILDCFDWKEWYNKPVKSTKRNTLRGGLPLYMLIKLPKEEPLRTHEQQEAGLVQLFTLLEREMELYRYTAAFSEFRVRIRQRCRDFSKAARPPRWKTYAKACMEKSDQYASFCSTERAKLAMAPKDVAQLECLRPSHVPTMRDRHQKSMEQESKATQSALAAATVASAPLSRRTTDLQTRRKDSDDEDMKEAEADEDNQAAADSAKPSKDGKKSKKKNKKKKQNSMVEDDQAMEQEDELVEGADWLED